MLTVQAANDVHVPRDAQLYCDSLYLLVPALRSDNTSPYNSPTLQRRSLMSQSRSRESAGDSSSGSVARYDTWHGRGVAVGVLDRVSYDLAPAVPRSASTTTEAIDRMSAELTGTPVAVAVAVEGEGEVAEATPPRTMSASPAVHHEVRSLLNGSADENERLMRELFVPSPDLKIDTPLSGSVVRLVPPVPAMVHLQPGFDAEE